MKKILVTGSGGIGGVNFVRALRATKKEFHIVGTDFNKYYIQFPEIDVRINSPRHSDPKFIKFISNLISIHKIDFLHPQPSSEAQVIAQNIEKIQTRTLLPSHQVIAQDKLETQKILSQKKIPVAKTMTIKSEDEIDDAFDSFEIKPLWIRAKRGAGGSLSLLCNSVDEIKHWVNLWVKKNKANFSDFMIQQNLPGQNIAWDSFWYEGKLIASFTRERLEYPFKHISPSGITGTPTVSKIIVDETVNKTTRQLLSRSKRR
jgi:carbamoyl-phosphate synthase large subunit